MYWIGECSTDCKTVSLWQRWLWSTEIQGLSHPFTSNFKTFKALFRFDKWQTGVKHCCGCNQLMMQAQHTCQYLSKAFPYLQSALWQYRHVGSSLTLVRQIPFLPFLFVFFPPISFPLLSPSIIVGPLFFLPLSTLPLLSIPIITLVPSLLSLSLPFPFLSLSSPSP